jgi:hypothetical protein
MTSEPGLASSLDPEQVVRLHGYGEMPLRSEVATVMTLGEGDRAEATLLRDQRSTLHLARIMQIARKWGISSTIMASRRVRRAARSVRKALEGRRRSGERSQIVLGTVRDAPLPSLLVAFLLGVIVARK